MDLSKVGRNDPCPCGSGKKFKRCHLGRENELVDQTVSPDPVEAAQRITNLPPARHPRAADLAGMLSVASAGGKEYTIKLVDLDAYLATKLHGLYDENPAVGGLLINPNKTRAKDERAIYIALSPQANDSTVVHQLAHAKDLVAGSCLPVGKARDVALDTGVPLELLEHSQEYGNIFLSLAEELGVDPDAEDEIVCFLARRQMLLPALLISKGEKEPLVAAAEKTMRFLMDSKAEIDARIRDREGYTGKTLPKKAGK